MFECVCVRLYMRLCACVCVWGQRTYGGARRHFVFSQAPFYQDKVEISQVLKHDCLVKFMHIYFHIFCTDRKKHTSYNNIFLNF